MNETAPLMLGVSGLRGIVGKSLTPEVAARFAGAFGTWLKGRTREQRPPVVLGADGRAGYEPLLRAAEQGLIAAGCSPWSIGIATTPTIGVKADHDDAAGAMVVTASHNPQEWNGLKCLVRRERGVEVVSACAPDAVSAAQIIERFKESRGPVKAAEWAPPPAPARDADACHIGPVADGVGEWPGAGPVRSRRFRVALDSVNGAGRFAGRHLLAGVLACELIHQGAEDSGVFPHTPEPTRENLEALCRTTCRMNADIGFAQDPDADRLAIVDERGEYIGEEYTLALAAESLLGSETARQRDSETGRKDRVLVANLSTSRMIDDIAARYGARVVRTPVGEANVVEAMKREKAAGHDVVLGGEGNGGVIWPRITYVRDSLSAMALVLALMARTGKKVSELVAAIPAYAIEKRKVDLARKEDAKPAIDKLAAAHRAQSGTTIDLQDGVRIDWPDRRSWLHVRASNTEPIMRLIAESPTAAESRAILDQAARVISG